MIQKRFKSKVDLKSFLEEKDWLHMLDGKDPVQFPCLIVICENDNPISFTFIYPEDIYFDGKGVYR